MAECLPTRALDISEPEPDDRLERHHHHHYSDHDDLDPESEKASSSSTTSSLTRDEEIEVSLAKLKDQGKYVKLNVGGSLHFTTVGTLTKHDNMLRAMFSGRLELQTDEEGTSVGDGGRGEGQGEGEGRGEGEGQGEGEGVKRGLVNRNMWADDWVVKSQSCD